MTLAESEPSPKGVWLDSEEVHQLRDQIQALKVGYALLIDEGELEDSERAEVYREMGEAISKLAESRFFRGVKSG
ncbi:MAG: hypothetical protein AAFU85_07555 [Planctomycetota bacterium]